MTSDNSLEVDIFLVHYAK